MVYEWAILRYVKFVRVKFVRTSDPDTRADISRGSLVERYVSQAAGHPPNPLPEPLRRLYGRAEQVVS